MPSAARPARPPDPRDADADRWEVTTGADRGTSTTRDAAPPASWLGSTCRGSGRTRSPTAFSVPELAATMPRSVPVDAISAVTPTTTPAAPSALRTAGECGSRRLPSLMTGRRRAYGFRTCFSLTSNNSSGTRPP